jgi:hypothetical protein
MDKQKPKRQSAKAILDEVIREMAKPRVAGSARVGDPSFLILVRKGLPAMNKTSF